MLKNGAFAIVAFVFILWGANFSYGYIHEGGHALIVKMLGGQVYDIYVNPLGTDAYTSHSYINGTLSSASVELAGMAVTTLLAFLTLLSDYAPLPVFVALRTAIYALNYAPGTDIYEVHQLLGNASFLISALLVAANLACAAIAVRAMLKNASLREPVLERLLHL